MINLATSAARSLCEPVWRGTCLASASHASYCPINTTAVNELACVCTCVCPHARVLFKYTTVVHWPLNTEACEQRQTQDSITNQEHCVFLLMSRSSKSRFQKMEPELQYENPFGSITILVLYDNNNQNILVLKRPVGTKKFSNGRNNSLRATWHGSSELLADQCSFGSDSIPTDRKADFSASYLLTSLVWDWKVTERSITELCYWKTY